MVGGVYISNFDGNIILNCLKFLPIFGGAAFIL